MSGLSRRQLLGLGAAGAVGVGGVAVAAAVAGSAGEGERTALGGGSGDGGERGGGGHGDELQRGHGDRVAFHGAHQAGIATPVQDRLHLAAFDVTGTKREDLVALLIAWTAAAARMTRGEEAGPGGAIPAQKYAPPQDTGEALGLPPARLTITIGLGGSLFDDRFGLAAQRPAALIDLPHFPKDNLDPARCDGDLVVQACADDPQVAVHAVRNLARIAFGTAAVRWSQLGFGKTSSTTPEGATPRNLFGFKDGTANIAGDDAAALDKHVWVGGDDGAAWLVGGSYLVARRIRMHIETWDRTSLVDQEGIVGRTKLVGAPLGLVHERDEVVPATLAPDAHVRIAHPDSNDGHKMLRRGYSFVDGSDGLGRLDAGLFFLAYVRDPRTQYVPVQTRMSGQEKMMEYLQHTGSGLWAVPPGVAEGSYVGQTLLEA